MWIFIMDRSRLNSPMGQYITEIRYMLTLLHFRYVLITMCLKCLQAFMQLVNLSKGFMSNW